MKKSILITLLASTALLSSFDQPIKIVRTSTKAQIRKAERDVIRRYKNKVLISVFNRNEQNEITTIRAQRYYPSTNQLGGWCESDNFGEMTIGANSFSIKDFGAK